MTTLYEKIARLPPSLLPKVERFVDSLPATEDGECGDCIVPDWDRPLFYKNGQRTSVLDPDHDWRAPLYDEKGKKIHPQPGCMKGTFVMHDNFFEPDDDWEEYM